MKKYELMPIEDYDFVTMKRPAGGRHALALAVETAGSCLMPSVDAVIDKVCWMGDIGLVLRARKSVLETNTATNSESTRVCGAVIAANLCKNTKFLLVFDKHDGYELFFRDCDDRLCVETSLSADSTWAEQITEICLIQTSSPGICANQLKEFFTSAEIIYQDWDTWIGKYPVNLRRKAECFSSTILTQSKPVKKILWVVITIGLVANVALLGTNVFDSRSTEIALNVDKKEIISLSKNRDALRNSTVINEQTVDPLWLLVHLQSVLGAETHIAYFDLQKNMLKIEAEAPDSLSVMEDMQRPSPDSVFDSIVWGKNPVRDLERGIDRFSFSAHVKPRKVPTCPQTPIKTTSVASLWQVCWQRLLSVPL